MIRSKRVDHDEDDVRRSGRRCRTAYGRTRFAPVRVATSISVRDEAAPPTESRSERRQILFHERLVGDHERRPTPVHGIRELAIEGHGASRTLEATQHALMREPVEHRRVVFVRLTHENPLLDPVDRA